MWRDVLAPVTILLFIAVVDVISNSWPACPEPALLILVGVAFTGFLCGLRSAVLSSVIVVAYALFFVAARNEPEYPFLPISLQALTLATIAPFLGITAGLLRQQVTRTGEALQAHLMNTPLGVIELYDDFEIRIWAGAAETIFGISSSKAVGKILFELPGVFYDGDDAAHARTALEELADGMHEHVVHASRTASPAGDAGHSRWFWSSTLQARKRDSRFLVLVEDITEHVRAQRDLEESKWEVIQRLVRAAEYRDHDTGTHVQRMSRFCHCLARAVGLSGDECDILLKASPLHDVGQIGIPDSILRKRGKLTSDEIVTMRNHTTFGANLLSNSCHPLVQMAEIIALTHHERWDGSGYPKGLKGEDIPLVGRIAAVCDVFDALITERPYKREWELHEALAEMQVIAGSYLDPTLVGAFMSIIPEIEEIMREYRAMDSYDALRDAA